MVAKRVTSIAHEPVETSFRTKQIHTSNVATRRSRKSSCPAKLAKRELAEPTSGAAMHAQHH